MLRLALILGLAVVAMANVVPHNAEHTPKLVRHSPDAKVSRTIREISENIRDNTDARSSVEIPGAELPAQIYNMYLSLGQSVLQGIRNTQAAILSLVPPVIVPVPVIIRGTRSVDPAVSTTLGDVQTAKAGRQFGLGFSGSGAQASSQSFGGGGGFGGFPGGGFGGGFSGSQASAGAGSFGGGGGFFG